MDKSTKRRTLGVLGVVLLTQLVSACVVVPVPARRMLPVVVQPGYAPVPYYHDHRGYDRHR
jgi:hypothetical protein